MQSYGVLEYAQFKHDNNHVSQARSTRGVRVPCMKDLRFRSSSVECLGPRSATHLDHSAAGLYQEARYHRTFLHDMISYARWAHINGMASLYPSWHLTTLSLDVVLTSTCRRTRVERRTSVPLHREHLLQSTRASRLQFPALRSGAVLYIRGDLSGDVGYIQRGRFRFLYNATLDGGRAINMRGVPDGFEAIRVRQHGSSTARTYHADLFAQRGRPVRYRRGMTHHDHSQRQCASA